VPVADAIVRVATACSELERAYFDAAETAARFAQIALRAEPYSSDRADARIMVCRQAAMAAAYARCLSKIIHPDSPATKPSEWQARRDLWLSISAGNKDAAMACVLGPSLQPEPDVTEISEPYLPTRVS
jgi:hypothetical protein